MGHLASRIRIQVTVLLVVGLMGSAAYAQVDQPVDGRRITIKRSSSGKESLRIVINDPDFHFPQFDEPGDPTLYGLDIELFGAGGELAELTVPASFSGPGWKRIPGRHKRYVYSNSDAPDGPTPVSRVVIVEGRGIKIAAKRTGLGLSGPQGSVGVRLTSDRRHCALFGPTTIIVDQTARFSAKNASAAALTTCISSSLGGVSTCGNGIIEEPFEQCDGPDSCETPFGNIDCRPAGVAGECTCCGGLCADVAGCCGPGIRPVPAPGPCNEGCISTSCEEPWSCNPGYDCVDGGCCGDVGAFCMNTRFPGVTMPCCEGRVCGGFVSFYAVCCVPEGGECGAPTDCCSNECAPGGTCAPSS